MNTDKGFYKRWLTILASVIIVCTVFGGCSITTDEASCMTIAESLEYDDEIKFNSDDANNTVENIDDENTPLSDEYDDDYITAHAGKEDTEPIIEDASMNQTEINDESDDIEISDSEEENEVDIDEINYTYETVDDIKYSFCSLNVRTLPDTTGDKIGLIGEGDDVHVIARCNETGWYKIEWSDNIDAFISDAYLLDEPVAVKEVEEIIIIDGPFVGVNGADADLVNYANQKWAEMVPENIRTLLLDNGYKLYVDKGSLSQRFDFDYSVIGVTSYGTKEIYLSHSKAAIKRAMTHEAGHALDSIYNLVSYSDEWREIFLAERDNFHDYSTCGDGSETSNPLEYFASVFDNIVNNAEQTKNEVPRSYEFVSRYM